MIPILVGLVIVALGVHRIQRHRVPSGAARQPGIVVDVQETHSLKNPRRPVVAVDHPGTGRRIEVEPDEYDNGTYQIADVMDVAYLPMGTGSCSCPTDQCASCWSCPQPGSH